MCHLAFEERHTVNDIFLLNASHSKKYTDGCRFMKCNLVCCLRTDYAIKMSFFWSWGVTKLYSFVYWRNWRIWGHGKMLKTFECFLEILKYTTFTTIVADALWPPLSSIFLLSDLFMTFCYAIKKDIFLF